jgi:hypothetical protein
VKKLLSILLLLIYTTASSGTALSTHYCMGDIADLSFGAPEDSDKCGTCGMEDMGCCHDESTIIKIDHSALHKTSSSYPDLKLPEAARPVFVVQDFRISSSLLSRYNQGSWKGQEGRPPTYLLYCVFRI